MPVRALQTLMPSVKNIADLVTKINRVNKDRALVADLLELSRMLKGFETDWNMANAKLSILANDIVKLKREITGLKGGSPGAAPSAAATPAEKTGERVADGFVWKKG